MDLVTDPAAFVAPAAGAAVTIGAYDGVHRGHRSVIAQLRRLAAEGGLASVVLTFDRHPASVVRPESAPRLLTDLEQKLELLASTGVDATVVLTFDHARSQEEPEDFVRSVLVDCLRARVVVVGEDFHFGRQRRGNVQLLREMGSSLGFEVVHVPLLHGISSTAVRRLVEAGEVEGAAELLGRYHEVRGVVERGDQRGRELGYPTANVGVPADILIPAPGIYAGWYGGDRAAAISVGRRPTFHDGSSPLVLEAYLLDFDGDLYGQAARVSFVRRLRDQERYDSTQALVAQMGRDVDATRSALGDLVGFGGGRESGADHEGVKPRTWP
ncbi:MAG TPA: bifunctional riboflavin kinase/FAD synthetase [Acidimicrobiales bacterium]|nr:bifunctional riboflavin kinase/FAD synthetase [Acidimicrobiales bacterium]